VTAITQVSADGSTAIYNNYPDNTSTASYFDANNNLTQWEYYTTSGRTEANVNNIDGSITTSRYDSAGALIETSTVGGLDNFRLESPFFDANGLAWPTGTNSQGFTLGVSVAYDGSTAITQDGVGIFTAPAGSSVEVNQSGSVSVSATPAPGLTETASVSSSGQVAETVSYSGGPFQASVVLDYSSNIQGGQSGSSAGPTLTGISANGLPQSPDLASVVSGTDNSNLASADTSAGSVLNQDLNYIQTDNVSALPTILDINIIPIVDFGQVDITDLLQYETALQTEPSILNDPSWEKYWQDPNTNPVTSPPPSPPPGPPPSPPPGPPPTDGGDPLVISTDNRGIQFVPFGASKASFDFKGTGVPEPTGWVAPNTGILVLVNDSLSSVSASNLLDFATLSTLDLNHDGVIDSSDPAFANIYVWVDANGDGVGQPGELLSLSALGIASIQVASSASSVSVGGNQITAVGSLSFADGSAEAIDQVTFANAPNEAVRLAGTSAPSLQLIQRALEGLPGAAAGDAEAALQSMNAYASTLESGVSKLLTDLDTARGKKYEADPAFIPDPNSPAGYDDVRGYQAPEIIFVGSGVLKGGQAFYSPQLLTTFEPQQPAGLNRINSSPLALGEYGTSPLLQSYLDGDKGIAQAATALETAAKDQARAEALAVKANTDNAVVGSAGDAAAANAAAVSESAWQKAFSDLSLIPSYLDAMSATVNTVQADVNRMEAYLAEPVPTNTGLTGYFGTGWDAIAAADVVALLGVMSRQLALDEIAYQTVVSAVQTAWNVPQAQIGLGPVGNVLTANSVGSLMVATPGTSSLNIQDVGPDTIVVLPGGNADVTNFDFGPNGSRIDFLNPGSTAYVTATAQGTQIVDGTSVVTLEGVSIPQLSFFDNFAGVAAIDFTQGNTTASFSPGNQYIQDGTTHVHTLIATGYGNTLTGGNGVDTIVATGQGSGNTLIAGRGLETFGVQGQQQNDTLVAGTGVNSVILNGSLDLTVTGTGGSTVEVTSAGTNGLSVSQLNLTSGALDTAVVGSGGSLTLSLTVMSGLDVAGGTLQVDQGGIVIGATISSGGTEIIESQGSDSGASVGNGGLQVVSGGTANGTVVGNGGAVKVLSEGQLLDPTIDGGAVTVSSGGLVQLFGVMISGSVTVSAGGLFEVESGAVAVNTTVLSGGEEVLSGGELVDPIIDGGAVTISSGGFVQLYRSMVGGSVTVSFGGLFEVESGVEAVGTVISSGGEAIVYSGGTASGTINYGGVVQISAGGTDIGEQMTGPNGQVDFGLAIGDVVSATGIQYVESGGLASNTTVDSGDRTTGERHGGIEYRQDHLQGRPDRWRRSQRQRAVHDRRRCQ
jgi:autotransporter passenger strand-loop-strand repeat protein